MLWFVSERCKTYGVDVSLERNEKLLLAKLCVGTMPIRASYITKPISAVGHCNRNLTVSGGFVIATATGLFFSLLALLISFKTLAIDLSVPSKP